VNGRFKFFSMEALRSIRGNAAVSFAATATVLIAIATLGFFLAVFFWTQNLLDTQREKLDLRAFIKLDATGDEINKAIAAVQAHPNVESVRFLSKADVLKEQRQKFPDAFDLLPESPLPATIVIQPDDPVNNDRIVNELGGLPYWLKDNLTPKGFSVDQKTTKQFLSAARILSWGAGGLMVLLVIAAILLIGNTIRLSIFARRREVEVMRLVGATNWFIRWPFVIEGLVFGLIGAVAAVALLVATKLLIVDRVLDIGTSPLQTQGDTTISFGLMAIILVAAGALMGALGSGITLRRFLKV